MARAIALENKQDGTSNILLEDPDIAAILQMTKEKLAGQIMAGLLERPKEMAVRNCVDKLNVLLQVSSKCVVLKLFSQCQSHHSFFSVCNQETAVTTSVFVGQRPKE